MGQVSAELSALPWRGRSERVWPQIAQALDELRAENDVVVIEGAGSPAEINLMASDIVNLRVARHADARCLLVTDIDRGGAFAHLYGTWALMPRGRPRADHGLRAEQVSRRRGAARARRRSSCEALTGVPTVATLPMWWRARAARGRRRVRRPQRRRAAKSRAPSPSSPIRASATSTNSSRCKNMRRRAPALGAQPGRRGRRRLDRAARLQEHQRRPGLAARAGAGPRDRRACGSAAARCSASAAGCRCWARR